MRGCKTRQRLALGERRRKNWCNGNGRRRRRRRRKGSGLEIEFNNAQNFASSLYPALVIQPIQVVPCILGGNSTASYGIFEVKTKESVP